MSLFGVPAVRAGALGVLAAVVVGLATSLKGEDTSLYLVDVNGKKYSALVPVGWSQEQIEAYVRDWIIRREENKRDLG